ncbi:MAG: hypothetical protein JWR80_5975 [Bradyrhizobium sp.]|nr:hypothetical protein [Bradyrhizobium sp.]
MDRINELRDEDLIDLGTVADETKGGALTVNDFQGGLQPIGGGLTDD